MAPVWRLIPAIMPPASPWAAALSPGASLVRRPRPTARRCICCQPGQRGGCGRQRRGAAQDPSPPAPSTHSNTPAAQPHSPLNPHPQLPEGAGPRNQQTPPTPTPQKPVRESRRAFCCSQCAAHGARAVVLITAGGRARRCSAHPAVTTPSFATFGARRGALPVGQCHRANVRRQKGRGGSWNNCHALPALA